MGKQAIEAITSIAIAIVGVAIISVLVGAPNTSGVIKSAGSAFSGAIQAAVSPIGGGGSLGGLGTFNSNGGASNFTPSI
jgi:PRD1 phage membrane DNA delivery